MPRAKLSDVSIKQLLAEVARRRNKLAAFVAQREALTRKIEELRAVAEAPAEQAAPVVGGGGRRPVRRTRKRKAAGRPLAEFVAEALASAPDGLSVKDIEKAVRAAGYPTAAETLYNPIMKALARGGFRKVEPGVYAARKAAGRPKAIAPSAGKPARIKPGRGEFPETAEQFILGLVKGAGMKTADINEAWSATGRRGVAAPTLSKLFKQRKVMREPVKGEKGFLYGAA